MAGVLQDSELQKHRLLNLDVFYFPNFVTVSSRVIPKSARKKKKKMSQFALRTILTYFK